MVFCLNSLLFCQTSSVEHDIHQILKKALMVTSVDQTQVIFESAKQRLFETGQDINNDMDLLLLECQIYQTYGRVLMTFWQKDISQEVIRLRAYRQLQQALDRYERLELMSISVMERLERSNSSEKLKKDKEWMHANSMLARCEYSNAWIYYYLSMVSQSRQEKEEGLRIAIDYFSNLTLDGYQSHPIIADCFLGQGLSLFELGQFRESLALLAPATVKSTPADIFKRMTLLRVALCKELRENDLLVQYVQDYLSGMDRDALFDALELDMMIDYAAAFGEVCRKKQREDKKECMGKLIELVNQIYSYGPIWQEKLFSVLPSNALGGALASLVNTRQAYESEDYKQAVKFAQAGLAKSDSGSAYRADLDYYRLVALWKIQGIKKHLSEIKRFLITQKKHFGHSSIIEIVIAEAQKTLHGQKASERKQMLELLDLIDPSFAPGASGETLHWVRALYLIEEKRFGEALSVLQLIERDSPVYRQAIYGIAVTNYQLALESSSKSMVYFEKACSQLFRYFDKEELVDSAIELDQNAIELLGIILKKIIETAPDHYLQHQITNKISSLKDVSHLGEIAARLECDLAFDLRNTPEALKCVKAYLAAPSITEKRAIYIYNQLDKLELSYRKQPLNQKAELLKEMYRLLVRHAQAKNRSVIAKDKIALQRRLALSYYYLGEDTKAIQALVALKNQYDLTLTLQEIRAIALSHENLKQYEEAIDHWQLLTSGLDPTTEDWVEANVYLIQCYIRIKKLAEAKLKLDYFLVKSMGLDLGDWQKPVDHLIQELQLEANDVP